MDMEQCVADTNITSAMSVPAVGKQDTVAECETQSKLVVKLSAKALADRLDRLQNGRKSKLNKASNLRKTIQGLMQNGKNSEVQNALDGYIELCDDIKCVHDSIMGLLPQDEKET